MLKLTNMQEPRENNIFSKLTPEQRLFFKATGSYAGSITAQGIELYLLCKENGVDFNDIFDQVHEKAEELQQLTQTIHHQVARNQADIVRKELEQLKINKMRFIGIVSAVVEVTEELFKAEQAGKPISEEELKRYLKEDYADLMNERLRLRTEVGVLIENTSDTDEKVRLKDHLDAAHGELEDKFNKKVRARLQT